MPPTDAAEVAFHYYPAASVASSQLPASELLEHMDGGGVAAFLSERRSDGWRWLRPRLQALKAFNGGLQSGARSPGPSSVAPNEDGDGQQDRATIWVGNLPASLAALSDPEEALAALFSSFGEVQKVAVRKKDGDRSWALVTLESAEKASVAAAAVVTHESARLKVELADVQEHLKRSQTNALAGMYEQHVQQDHRPALAHFMAKVATRGRREGAVEVIKRWKWLKLRTQTIVAMGGFKLASSEAKRQVLTSAARRLNGFVRRSGLARSSARSSGCLGLEKLFAMLDKDNSGKVDVDEFRSGIKSVIGLSFDDQTINVLIKHMDADGDGEVCQIIVYAAARATL